MPRKPRIDFPGAWHHVMHRGARKAPVFKEDAHCHLFLEIVEKVVHTLELEIHAYSLMPNHYHLLVHSRHGNLSSAMKRLNAAYTQRVNWLEKWDGPVFKGRFRSQLIEDETNLPYLLAYIHLNPLKAELITRLQSHAWSSHRVYLGRDTAPGWLNTGYFESIFEDSDALHGYVLDMHRGKLTWPEQMAMDSGWLKETGERAVNEQGLSVETRFLTVKAATDRICEITGADMARLRKAERGPRANPERRFAVWALNDRTQMSHGEIGKLLGMSTSQVGHVLRRMSAGKEQLGAWIDEW